MEHITVVLTRAVLKAELGKEMYRPRCRARHRVIHNRWLLRLLSHFPEGKTEAQRG